MPVLWRQDGGGRVKLNYLVKSGIMGIGELEEKDTIKGRTYFYIPFLRAVLERMEKVSKYAVLTLGSTNAPVSKEGSDLIHISFVSDFPGEEYVENKGVFIAPRAPMPRSAADSVMILEFMNECSDWFSESPYSMPFFGEDEE